MKLFTTTFAFALAVPLCVGPAQAAFIVEPGPGGKANANFSYQDGTAVSTSVAGSAPGLSGVSSVYGGNGTIDEYTFSYTPGTDADNTVFLPGDALGTHRLDPSSTLVADPQSASGQVGGASGTYKVFITWPQTGNANSAGSVVTVTSDGAPIVLDPVDQNGDPAFPLTYTETGAAGNNKWLLIGTVDLTAGNTYTVTQLANVASFVSQRNAGVMWELQVPEPSTFALMGLALASIVWASRRRSV